MSILTNDSFGAKDYFSKVTIRCGMCNTLIRGSFEGNRGGDEFAYIKFLNPPAVFRCPKEDCDNAFEITHYYNFVAN